MEINPPNQRPASLRQALFFLLTVLFVSSAATALPDQKEEKAIAEMIAVEEKILALSPTLPALAEQARLMQFQLPKLGPTKRLVLKGGPEYPLVAHQTFTETDVPANRLWHDVFSAFEDVETAKFYLIDGSFSDNGDLFYGLVGFEGRVRLKDGRAGSLTGKQKVTWQGPDIVAWQQKPLTLKAVSTSFFTECLDEALPKTDDYLRAQQSIHEENIVSLFTKDSFKVRSQIEADYLDLDSAFQHPGLTVCDANGDGWDDLYVMGRWGRNQLLINQQNGTFLDEAGQRGLAVDGLCTSAIFADLDNDGDQDAVVGRSLARALIFENREGKFYNISSKAMRGLPYLVSTISAVDYDQDGLLDLYLGLYGPPQQKHGVKKWSEQFFPAGMAREIQRRAKNSHRYLSRLGPPNLLLKNSGNLTFTIPPEAAEVAEWHQTHQATWADFDQDGDPDLYVCNDFAPDHLYENTGPPKPGKPRFQDISTKQMQGFGMGAAWADIDQSGTLDLYVTNMFSKAGRRITDTIDGLDPRVPYSAQGNLLFLNDGSKLVEKGVSLGVHKVGWAYGAQFLDVDNDTWWDVYSSSGFYTAPKEVATEKDL